MSEDNNMAARELRSDAAAATLQVRCPHREGWAVFNPHDKPVDDLPVIYGFNNGGSPGWMSGVLLAEDGTGLGGHVCSHEFYMPGDLGVQEGSRPDRHNGFREHYPDGYRMAFVGAAEVKTHPGLDAAYQANQARRAAMMAADGAGHCTASTTGAGQASGRTT